MNLFLGFQIQYFFCSPDPSTPRLEVAQKLQSSLVHIFGLIGMGLIGFLVMMISSGKFEMELGLPVDWPHLAPSYPGLNADLAPSAPGLDSIVLLNVHACGE